jgi:hypothetical protein
MRAASPRPMAEMLRNGQGAAMQPFTVYDLEKRVQTRAKAEPGTS